MSIRIELTGNLTKDPELRFTNSGRAVADVTVASNERYRDREGTWQNGKATFVRVTAWSDLAKRLAENFRKGDWVTVEGRRIEATPVADRQR